MRGVWGITFPRLGREALRFSRKRGDKAPGTKPVCTSNPKDIEVRHHFLRELMFKREFVTTHVESEEQRADFLTKHNVLLPPGFSDETLMSFSRLNVLCYDFRVNQVFELQ